MLFSFVRSLASNVSLPPNIVQPGVENGDPLSMVKITSAKQWKAISRKLTINLDGIDLNEGAGVDPRNGDFGQTKHILKLK